MMMSKPEPEQQKPVATKKKNPADSVADLEKRLADLSAATPTTTTSTDTTPAFATKPTPTPAAAASAASKSNTSKNALLARIMAAQERAKQAQQTAPTQPVMQPPPAQDLLSMDDAAPPSYNQMNNSNNAPPPPPPPAYSAAPAPPPAMDFMSAPDNFMMAPPAAAPPADTAPPPPPAFDDALLPPASDSASVPPPSFDSMVLPPAAAPPTMSSFDPHHAPPAVLAPPSAPAFEDLMMMDDNNNHNHNNTTPMMPPPVQPPTQQQQTSDEEEAIQAILAMEGMSEADKQELINEQLKIMKSIEANKKTAQQSAADAFESRSFTAAVGGNKQFQLHGQERTRQAIDDGTAVMVQCTSCENWMQVTGSAQLMFCPVCQTVSPVAGGTSTQEDAEQMLADLKLAEQLQKEEYEAADRQRARSSRAAATSSPSSAAAATGTKKEQSWMEWLGFGTPAPAPAEKPRGNVGEITHTSSREEDEEADRLLANRASGGRTATQQPLFACVTDSISSAANYAMTAMNEDEEGNVHGVDSTSLLAVPQVGRQQKKSSSPK